jgi:uncharacterized membrane protein
MDISIKILLLITALGIINTIYLSYHVIRGSMVKCVFLPQESCDKVQKSKYSKTFGVPNPYLGLLMLAALFILILMYSTGAVPFWIVFAIITAGFIFSVYFLYIQAAILKAYCTWCVVSFFVFLLLFIIALIITVR